MNMQQHGISSALVSTDRSFRTLVGETLAAADRLALRAEVAVPFDSLGDAELKTLREAEPELVFVDLSDDPEMGIRFIRFLADQHPGRRFVAAGPMLEPALLMEAMRAGVNEYLPKPVTDEALKEALGRIVKKLAAPSANGTAPREAGKVYSVFSAKGGSGTTTVATNLAVHIQQLTGKKTLLVDMDLELGEIAVFLGMQPRFNFVDMIRNFHRMDADLLASYIEKHESGVHLLSAPFHPEKAEAVTPEQIHEILHFLRQHYDYVVVDTSKSFSPATLATLERADEVFLVTTVDLPSLRNIKRTLPLLERITGGNKAKLRLVVNRHQSTDLISLKEVQQTLGLDVYHTLANDFAAVSESINAGKPVLRNADAPFTHDLKELGARITGLSAATNGKRGRLGVIRKFFGKKQEEESHA